jgi:hypothetical protein
VIGIDVEWEAACDWFWRDEVKMDPNAVMPDSIKPPPALTSSTKSSSVQSSTSSQSWQSVQPPLPADLAHLDDLYQAECAWLPGPVEGAGREMPDSIKPPPMPNPHGNTNASRTSTARRPSATNPNKSWVKTPESGGMPVSNKRKGTS